VQKDSAVTAENTNKQDLEVDIGDMRSPQKIGGLRTDQKLKPENMENPPPEPAPEEKLEDKEGEPPAEGNEEPVAAEEIKVEIEVKNKP